MVWFYVMSCGMTGTEFLLPVGRGRCFLMRRSVGKSGFLFRGTRTGVMGGGGPRFSGRKTEEDLYCS